MKTFPLIFASLLLAAASAIASPGWTTDLEAAIATAKKEKKSVLIEFTGSDWCPPCQMMQKNVFSKKSFISKASKDFILVELDFPNGDPEVKEKNQPYAKEYKIKAFPTVVLLDQNGKEFHRFTASKFPSTSKFLDHLKSSLSRKDLE